MKICVVGTPAQRRTFLFGLLVATLAGMSAPAEAAPACDAPASFRWFGSALGRLAERLAEGKPVTVVAIGSSSTAGAGASSPAASYPSRLEAALRQRFPGQNITVLNRGVNGEVAADMIARFDSAVLPERPDLVIWQVGSNAVLRDLSIDSEAPLIREGIRRLKASGADVIVMNPQYAPKVLEKFDVFRAVDVIGATAKAEGVGLFQRFALMRHWYETDRMPFEAFLSPDGLHMNDWSYACIGQVLADGIVQAGNSTLMARTTARP